MVAEPPGMLGTELQPYARAVLDFNLCPISPAPKLLFMHAACVYVCTSSCMSSSIWKPEGSTGFHPLPPLRQALSLTWTDWTLSARFCLHLPSSGITITYYYTRHFMSVLGTGLRPSSLPDKHLNQAFFPTQLLFQGVLP